MKAKKSKKPKWVDDGRTVANMNVDGMPWNDGRNVRPTNANEAQSVSEPQPQANQLSKQETRKVMFSALLAGLVIGVVFIGAAALFILFCVNVWFQ